MIKEEYVSFESAKLLKEAGFPQDGFLTYYSENGSLLHSDMRCAQRVARCTKWHAMQWLRDEKNLTILFEMISPSEAKDYGLNAGSYTVDIYDTCGLHLFGIDDLQTLPTYEAAAESGIQEACKYIIKNKKQ